MTTTARRSPVIDQDNALPRSKSEKTVDTAVLSRGSSSRSNLHYSRTSSRHSMTSARSNSHSSILTASRQNSDSSIGVPSTPDPKAKAALGESASELCSAERRVRKLGYSEEDRFILGMQEPPRVHKPGSVKKTNRLIKMLSWVASPSAKESTESSEGGSGDKGKKDDVKTPQNHARSRSAVFVKTPNETSEGIIYR